MQVGQIIKNPDSITGSSKIVKIEGDIGYDDKDPLRNTDPMLCDWSPNEKTCIGEAYRIPLDDLMVLCGEKEITAQQKEPLQCDEIT